MLVHLRGQPEAPTYTDVLPLMQPFGRRIVCLRDGRHDALRQPAIKAVGDLPTRCSVGALSTLSQHSVLSLCESRRSWKWFFGNYIGIESFCLYWCEALMREK